MRGLDEGLAILERANIGVPAGETLYSVLPGDTVRVSAQIEYRGTRLENVPFYAAICQIVLFVWDPIWENSALVTFPESVDLVPYDLSVDIPITEVGVRPWSPGMFSLFVELKGYPAAGRPQLANVIEVLIRPNFQNFAITGYEKV